MKQFHKEEFSFALLLFCKLLERVGSRALNIYIQKYHAFMLSFKMLSLGASVL